MNMGAGGQLVLILLGIVLFALFAVPLFLLILGVWRLRRTQSRAARIAIGTGIAVCAFWLLALSALVRSAFPGQSGIVTQGHSPEGLEYCVVQTYKEILEPYQVSFYIRDSDGLWRWSYLEHEDFAWRSAQVEFTESVAQVSRNGKPFLDIPLPTGVVDPDTVPGGYSHQYCPSDFAVEDVLKFHNELFR